MRATRTNRGYPVRSDTLAQDGEASSAGVAGERTVAGATCMMANIYHEAFCLLRGLMDGTVKLNKDSKPILLSSGVDAVATMIYLNDVLINVDGGIVGTLRCQEILDAYGLNFDFDTSSLWVSGTPEGISGETRLLGQVGILPVRTGAASLYGNKDSRARRNVASSRGSI